VSLDLAFDDAQQSIRDAVAQFCRERCSDEVVKASAGEFPAALWRELAELGVLALVTPEGEGRAVELVAAVEALGAAVFPGPLAGTFFATQLLPEAERRDIASGDVVVSVGVPPLMPFATVAGLFIEVDEQGRAWRGRVKGEIRSVETLGGEPWGRLELERDSELSEAHLAFDLHDIVVAAYLAAAAHRLVDATAEHVRTRKQFGRALGEFQAVAHPLANCAMAVETAAALARSAAYHFDGADSDTAVRCGAARVSARRAAVHTVHVAHQLFGAVGITLEGEVFHVSRRIRQLASQAPDEQRARANLLRHFEL
jgi:alkylation response protein AidB-like acyl-CoA dehydrogenase